MASPSSDLYHEVIGTGPPVLLMHGGMGLDHTLFRPWLDPLAADHALVYYDHRGNGRSPAPESWDAVTHATWADDADVLRDSLAHERCVVFGHSYGGYLAVEYALRHPDRVRGLVLVAATPVLDYTDVVVANARRLGSPRVADDAIALLSTPPADDAAMLDGFRRILPLYFRGWDPARGAALLARMVPSAAAFNHANRACLPVTDLRGRLGEVRAPTLVVSGRHDWIMPPEQAGGRMAAGIAGAAHVIMEESGHFPFVEEQVGFLDVVRRWLSALPARND